MSAKPTILLNPISIAPFSHPFQEICRWPFADSYVSRLLHNDIPQRAKYGKGRIWIYADPDRQIVGFGTLDVCLDYGYLTQHLAHPHIPLLGVRPDMAGKGIGDSIVKHLISEAALLASWPHNPCYGVVFLEVYMDNEPAIKVYKRNGFANLNDTPTYDESEKKSYFVMVRRVSIATPASLGSSDPPASPR